MELMLALVVLFFGFRLIGLIFSAIFSLIGLLVRVWLFGIAATLILVLIVAGSSNSDHGENRPQETNVQVPDATPVPTVLAERVSPTAPLSLAEWIGGGVAAFAVIGLAGLWIRAYVRRRSATRIEIDRSSNGVAPLVARDDATPGQVVLKGNVLPPAVGLHQAAVSYAKFGAPKVVVPPEEKIQKVVEVLDLTPHDLELMADFRRREPWVLVDVPPRFIGPFLRECLWLKDKLKRDAAEADQLAVLREVSSGWTWASGS